MLGNNLGVTSIIITLILIPFHYDFIYSFYNNFNNLSEWLLVFIISIILSILLWFIGKIINKVFESDLKKKKFTVFDIIYFIGMLVMAILTSVSVITFFVFTGPIWAIWSFGFLLTIIIKSIWRFL